MFACGTGVNIDMQWMEQVTIIVYIVLYGKHLKIQ